MTARGVAAVRAASKAAARLESAYGPSSRSVRKSGTVYFGLGVPENAPTYGACLGFTGGLNYRW